MLKKINYLLIVGFFVFIPFWGKSSAQSQTIAAPTILNVNVSSVSNLAKPIIVGVSQAGTEVSIYIDGTYAGLATTSKASGVTENFSFIGSNPLSEGTHRAIAVSRDKYSLTYSAPSKEVKFAVLALFAPTIILPKEKAIVGQSKPIITGLTQSNSLVKVYIDGVYNGKTPILQHKSGTANFAYVPFQKLSIGWHNVYVVAEELSGKKSKTSQSVNFKVEPAMPAPVLFKPVVSKKTVPARPFIVGLAKNNSLIKVFIDQKLAGQFQVVNHPSGTANFAYLPSKALTKGRHSVYTTATDSRGKVSSFSNTRLVYVGVVAPATPAKQEATVKTGEPSKQETTTGKPAGQISKPVIKVEKPDSQKPQTAASSTKQETASTTGVSNEGQKENQAQTVATTTENGSSKSKINLVIFIVFLAGVIGWIFWVNRELIKERQAQKGDKPSEKNK